ncbi:unnamed protein product, partial [Phaeothamnion confervicola]
LAGVVISLYLVSRPKVVIFVQRWTKIVDDITKSIDGLEVSYGGDKDLRNLVRVTGFVQNSGSSDIDQRDVYDPLTITLPGQSRWLQVTASSNEVRTEAKFDGPSLSLSWDLLRRGERVRFDALFEYLPPDGKGMLIDRIFRASGRIKNTAIKTIREIDVVQRPVLRLGTLAASIWMLFLV